MKYFKLYEEYTKPRQFIFDVNISDSDQHQETEEKYAKEWEFRGEIVSSVEGVWDEETSDIEIQLVDEHGTETTKLRAVSHFEIGPISRGDDDFSTLEVEKPNGESKEYDVKDEHIKGLSDYGSLMESILTIYKLTIERPHYFTGKRYCI